ncbi:protein of unknown function [Candidatus Methylomirabilis oxygeniifera]|uniref:Uncharacterized protein n=1 Tax=Methylomirabilis oxygeniifera TaxID=671143 RepID=D5MMB1_METO1|nr:protein of unknown function [Candidatus Methylomirabilis oxyfera]
MSNSQNYDLISFEIEDDSIISYPKTVGAEFGIRQFVRIAQRVTLISAQSFPHAFLRFRIQSLNVYRSPLSVNQPVDHRPKTSSWVRTFRALYCCRASLILARYSGDVDANRSSKNASRSSFFILLTAAMIAAECTSIFKVLSMV